MMKYLLGLLLCLALLVESKQVTFENHKVLRISPKTIDHLAFLNGLFYTNNSLDFWTEPSAFGRDVDIRVDETQYDWLVETVLSQGMNYHVMIDNVQELVEKQMLRKSDAFDFTQYNTYSAIMDFLHSLPAMYPDRVSLITLPPSYQGREMLVVKITNPNTANKKGIWFDSLLHAREWITGGTVLWMLNQFLLDADTDTVVKQILDSLELYILPVFNPDGYSYTWTDNRMWRKTRSPNPGSSCIGTDPNRNWDFEWGGEGISRDPCSDAYLGPKAFSEIEVNSVGLYLRNNSGKFRGYINFHSYSQLWMSPWGYTAALPPDFTIQDNLSAKCVAALQSVNNIVYEHGNIAVIIYPASGSSADYTYATAKILYSYGVELRDTGQYGFLLPPNQIVPSGRETYEAVKVWALEAINN